MYPKEIAATHLLKLAKFWYNSVSDQYYNIQLSPTSCKSEEGNDIDIKTTFSHPQGSNPWVEEEIHKNMNWYLEYREL